MMKFIIDTNIFFNTEADTGLGDNPAKIVKSLQKIVRNKETNKNIELYISSMVADELLTFHKGELLLADIFEIMRVRSPNIDTTKLPARLFLKIIAEYRENHRQAIRIAEDQLLQAAREVSGEKLDNKEMQIRIGKHVNKLRERYRQATRWNQIDSVADMEMILLALELDATIVSADEGLCRWAKEFGIEWLPPRFLAERLGFDQPAHR